MYGPERTAEWRGEEQDDGKPAVPQGRATRRRSFSFSRPLKRSGYPHAPVEPATAALHYAQGCETTYISSRKFESRCRSGRSIVVNNLWPSRPVIRRAPGEAGLLQAHERFQNRGRMSEDQNGEG